MADRVVDVLRESRTVVVDATPRPLSGLYPATGLYPAGDTYPQARVGTPTTRTLQVGP